MLKAIIFDMDGVIVDSEILDYKFQKEFILKEGGSTNEEELSELIGKSYNDLYGNMLKLIGNKCSMKDLIDKFTIFIEQRYEEINYISIFREDILGILSYAKSKKIKLAVASSSPEKHIHRILKECNIFTYFDIIVSGENFPESKPNPEIYLHTLNKLKVSPQESIAIEDSYSGILAAKAAKIPVIAYEENRMPVDQSMADFTGQDMKKILRLIHDLG
ncbi:HAD family hydrolase [Oceanobacillus manasiensis]|uniref:HAD family hydrolase n=1 Tax=Oceanobacillus manasiensis TaxID=586413 RepID=UPI0005A60BF4|nr:HAD family phosphatase [Oceanobacillus manasiensis]